MRKMLQTAAVWATIGGSVTVALAGDAVPIEAVEEVRVCACDCVNQYELKFGRPAQAGLACRGQRRDGEWTAVEPSPYTPADSSRFLFHTKDRFTRFVCETGPRL